MEQYLEEKKASQKRPAATFQRQDKKKTVYQTPQKSMTLSNSQMKDYDCILGLDWLEEHYALVDCRRKKIVFRIPGEDEFSHPLPKNLAGKLVISAMKAMRMVNKGFLDPPIHPRFRARVCVSAQTWLDGKVPGRPDHPWRPSTMPLTLSQRPETAVEFFWTEQFSAMKLYEISNLKHVKRLCIVGDPVPLEEAAETDSERGD
ncbi:hypothetical protein Taro_028823 [Colocasia esculenta]|uniref:Uncharacterized protein n=1 Tax=Colocasia esculenta TaxID=4460 RepID=A0A843VI92_COLES|nr:hypothetical protein [Colocasia esculenta]